MNEAIVQNRRGYTMTVDPTASRFFVAYWEYLRRHHPRIFMRKPTPKGRKSNWVVMRGSDFPKNGHIYHKIDQSVVELGFHRRTIEDLDEIQSDWPTDIRREQKGKTASLAIDVPQIDIAKRLSAQEAALENAIASAYRLMPFATRFGESI